MDSLKNTSAIAAFSNELRIAREFRHITLEEVSRITCVSLPYLQALEAGNWERVPDAYRRGYLALLAEAVGMNREKVLKSYQALIAGQAGAPGAVLDDSPAVLSKPEHKALTRAKIRTDWYTRLAGHPIALRAATLLIILIGFGFLFFSRYTGGTRIAATDFEAAVFESAARVHGTLAVLSVTENPADGHWLEWMGLQSGNMVIHCDSNESKQIIYNSYDTIRTQFTSILLAEICPSASLKLLTESNGVSVVSIIHGDTLQLEAKIGLETEDLSPSDTIQQTENVD
ncbi:MAG: helix-turn-helix domain-containing protein [bacterium]|nr:helix-turn-helix domain-containing protein [bacterium]